MGRRCQATHAPGLPCGLPSNGSRMQSSAGCEHLRPARPEDARIARPGEPFDCKRCLRILANDKRRVEKAQRTARGTRRTPEPGHE